MRIPCGRTKKDNYLCCLRNHKWYNSYWVITKLRWPDVVLENRKKLILTWERRCLICGSRIQLGGHPFEKDVW